VRALSSKSTGVFRLFSRLWAPLDLLVKEPFQPVGEAVALLLKLAGSYTWENMSSAPPPLLSSAPGASDAEISLAVAAIPLLSATRTTIAASTRWTRRILAFLLVSASASCGMRHLVIDRLGCCYLQL
jgi:hypothetical protein